MKHIIDAHAKRNQTTEELHLCFDKDFFIKSKYLLFAMGIAALYCLGYGLILFHEFKKMGVLEAVGQLL